MIFDHQDAQRISWLLCVFHNFFEYCYEQVTLNRSSMTYRQSFSFAYLFGILWRSKHEMTVICFGSKIGAIQIIRCQSNPLFFSVDPMVSQDVSRDCQHVPKSSPILPAAPLSFHTRANTSAARRIDNLVSKATGLSI